jgi:molybdopterin-binding protein
MANVDAATRLLLERILENLTRSKEITIILSTHDVDQALRLGQQIITLHEGNIVEGGLENIFHGSLREVDDGWVFDTGRTRFAVLPQREDARTAIIPPEAILLSLDPKSTSARNVLWGKISGIRMRNGAVDVTIDAGEEFTSRITEKSLKELGLQLGMEIYLLIKAGAIRVC